MSKEIGAIHLLYLCAVLCGCVAGGLGDSRRQTFSSLPSGQSGTSTTNASDSQTGIINREELSSQDRQRLAVLWQERNRPASLSDYPLGPGDILQINVPRLDEISQERVRIAGDGTIELPLVGILKASGLTERALKNEIHRILQAGYKREPEVSLFVVEHHNRQVAVVGAVTKPGLYALTSETNTILDMVSLAGGMTKGAAPRLLFIPAPPPNSTAVTSPQQVASSGVVPVAHNGSSSAWLTGTEPITLDLRSLTRGGNQRYMTLPARPGDVIMIPESGNVLVDGWVEKPGSYPISPGMTVLGAVTAAGGLLYPADTSTVGHK